MAGPLEALRKVCPDTREARPEEGVLGVPPALVAAPGTVGEAADVMRVAAEHDLAVVPRGAETRLDWGRPPGRCDLLVDTARLDEVIEHAAGDLVVKVQAGLAMDALADVLAAERQQLALDTPLPGSTVGGTLATAAGGPRRLRYGSARDLLIGVTVVRADGAVAKSGGKVVKNVAGYDLGKLFTGSYGTLGLIVEAAFRLHPLPAARAYATATFDEPGAAHDAVQRVLQSALVPAALEIDMTGRAGTVAALVEGAAEGVDARAPALAALLGADAASDRPPDWWGAYPEGSTLIEITAPPTALPLIIATVEEHRAQIPEPVLRGSAGLGSLHLGLDAAPEPAARLLTALRGALAPVHGRAVVRYAPEPVREAVDLWGPVPALALMRRVKDQFDPGRRLSPGRFAGGI